MRRLSHEDGLGRKARGAWRGGRGGRGRLGVEESPGVGVGGVEWPLQTSRSWDPRGAGAGPV